MFHHASIYVLASPDSNLISPPPTSLAFEKPFFISREWPILEMKCPLAGLEVSAFLFSKHSYLMLG